MPHRSRPTIFIIDDDASVRRALGRVMTLAGLDHMTFESADAFLAASPSAARGCIVADMTLPGLSGMELKQTLNASQSTMPLIFLTANDSPECREAAHEAGAEGYFRKPVDTQALLDAVHWALNEQPLLNTTNNKTERP
jgi:FixJ family two-component response regulator